MSTDGISALRSRKASRNQRQAPPPRHPMPTGVVAEFEGRGGEEAPASGPVAEAAPTPAAPATASTSSEALPPPAATRPVPRPAAPAAAPARRATTGASGVGAVDRKLPDLEIDWTDPLMHVASPTRVSVANSVATRFKAVADQPGSAPQTQLIMQAVSDHLAELPELVLKRRPEESGAAPTGFFVRRAPVQKPEPWQPVYMRPIAGEVEALRRIVEWVNDIITAGHPGRQKSSRSEVVTAALDASYPAIT